MPSLTESGCRTRQQRLWDAVPGEIGWLLIADPRHVQYLVNFWVNPLSFSLMERGFLVLHRTGRSTLVADNFGLRSRAADHFAEAEAIAGWYDHSHSVANRDDALLQTLQTEIDKLSSPGLIESQWVPAAIQLPASSDGKAGDGVNLNQLLRDLRRAKLPDEVSLIEACARATEAGHEAARTAVKPGATELDVYRAIQSAAIDTLGQAAIVYGDFQANSPATPKAGGLPTRRALGSNELLIVDYSVVCCGYRSDFTNTLAVGVPSADQQRIMETCQRALAAGGESLKPGRPAAEVYRTVSEVLETAGFGPLRHHAGHGLGLGHPEAPILVPNSDDVLVESDVVTIEPGIYAEGIGGVRIEHNYLVSSDGIRQLSHHRIGFD